MVKCFTCNDIHWVRWSEKLGFYPIKVICLGDIPCPDCSVITFYDSEIREMEEAFDRLKELVRKYKVEI